MSIEYLAERVGTLEAVRNQLAQQLRFLLVNVEIWNAGVRQNLTDHLIPWHQQALKAVPVHVVTGQTRMIQDESLLDYMIDLHPMADAFRQTRKLPVRLRHLGNIFSRLYG